MIDKLRKMDNLDLYGLFRTSKLSITKFSEHFKTEPKFPPNIYQLTVKINEIPILFIVFRKKT